LGGKALSKKGLLKAVSLGGGGWRLKWWGGKEMTNSFLRPKKKKAAQDHAISGQQEEWVRRVTFEKEERFLVYEKQKV